MAFTFTLATALCMIVSANLAKQEDTNKLSVNLDSSFRERHEKNAEGGNVDAMLNLGFYYFNKTNRLLLSAPKKQLRDDEYIDTRDFVKAKRYFEMAAAKNSPEAYVGLGLMTFRGLDCIPSREHALFYFRKAYEKDAHNALLYNVLKLCDISIEEVLGD